jgi:hypothetical protein
MFFRTLASLVVAAPLAHAAIIGFEDFNYTDGPISGKTGGTGWNVSGGTSDWSGGANVGSGALVTDANVGAFREYGADENASAFMATGIIYYKFTLSIGATVPNYAGLSSFDFGSEKVFFGRTYTNQLGIDESGVGTTLTGITPQPNTTYTFIGIVDFNNDVLSLFVNPDGSDVYDPAAPTGAGNTADAIRTGFTSTNWSSQIRLQSGDQGTGVAPVSWDNVTVATAPADVGLAAPEPGSALLGMTAGAALLARRRRARS